MPNQIEQQGYIPSKKGLLILNCLVIIFFFIFVLRFWYLQIHKGESFAKQSLENRLRSESIYALRGFIADSEGNFLAENRNAFGLALIREDCLDLPATFAQISQWTNTPLEYISTKFYKDSAKIKPFEPVLLLNDLSFDLVAKIEANLYAWSGVRIDTRAKRTYPYANAFAHILGYVAEANETDLQNNKNLALGDIIGKQGLEYVFEDHLRGQKGTQNIDVNVLGRVLGRKMTKKPEQGNILQLNINAKLQQTIMDILGEQTGSVVVMESETGKILALVTTPAYDNNLFASGLSQKDWNALRDDLRYPLQNRGIQSVYPPGSVWKVMMAGLFLKSGINPRQTVTCTGEVALGNHIFRCWKKGGHGVVNLKRSLVESCDVYYYTIGDRVGIDALEKFARSCGFGSLTGIELPYEKAGLVPSREYKLRRTNEKWQSGDTYNVSIGQGMTLTTPLQLAVFISSLLNGGNLLEPQVIAGKEPVLRRQIALNKQDREFLLEAMRETVETQAGTAKVLRQEHAIIGGKTGTAQVVKLKMIGEKRLKTSEMEYFDRDHAWIASWGIFNDKKIVVVGMIEHGGGGSSVAGPVVKKVYDAYFAIENEKKKFAEKPKNL